jgi:hypothetical protein
MESLPREILEQITPDARGWVMLSHASHTMAARMRCMFYEFRDRYCAKLTAIKTRAYVIAFDTLTSHLEFHGHDNTITRGVKPIHGDIADVMAVYYMHSKPTSLYALVSYDAAYALMIVDIRTRPVSVTPTIPRIGEIKTGTNSKEILEILHWLSTRKHIFAGDRIVGSVLDNVTGNGIMHAPIKFFDGELLGDGEYMYVFEGSIVRSTMDAAQLLKKLPQLAGHIFSAQLLF